MFGGKTTAQTSILAKDFGNFFKELSAKHNHFNNVNISKDGKNIKMNHADTPISSL